MKIKTLEATRVLVLEPECDKDFLNIGIIKGKLKERAHIYPACSDSPCEARIEFSDVIELMSATS